MYDKSVFFLSFHSVNIKNVLKILKSKILNVQLDCYSLFNKMT